MSIHKYMFLWWLNGCLYTNICSYDYLMDVYTQIYVLMMIKWMFIHKYMFLWLYVLMIIKWMFIHKYMFLWWLNGCLYTNICSYDY